MDDLFFNRMGKTDNPPPREFIFLDVDGVLNSKQTFAQNIRTPTGQTGIDPELVRRLHSLTNERTVIVLTSDWKESWKENKIGTCGRYLRKCLAKCNLEIADMTVTDIHSHRGQGVIKYLADHNYSLLRDHYVILDDHIFDFAQYEDLYLHFVRTDALYGLTYEDVEKARLILSK